MSRVRKALSGAGHRNFTVEIFPNAGHSLGEMPSKSRMAPGVFETKFQLRVRQFAPVHIFGIAASS